LGGNKRLVMLVKAVQEPRLPGQQTGQQILDGLGIGRILATNTLQPLSGGRQ